MRPSLLLLLLLLLFLSLGSAETATFVGCGSVGVGGYAAFGCSTGSGDDPCDYIVTVQATVLLDADSSPLQGASVTIDTGIVSDTKVTDTAGQVKWDDTAFLTGFSADCGGKDVGTVEPYDDNTAFTYAVIVSAPGFAPAVTSLTITRSSRDISLTVRIP